MAEAYFPNKFKRLIFQYVPQQLEKAYSALSWHLTSREKLDIARALDNPGNQQAFGQLNENADGRAFAATVTLSD